MKVQLLHHLEDTSGDSNGKQWRRVKILCETLGEYPKKVAFDSASMSVAEKLAGIAEGSEIDVEFNPVSREYNGKWYTNVNIWKVEGGSQRATGPAPKTAAPQATPEEHDDLPF